MLDRLQVEQIMKNYLVSIDNEIKESYAKFLAGNKNDFVRNVNEFTESIEALLDYYTEPMYKSGRTYILKRIYASIDSELTDAEDEFIFKYKSNTIGSFGRTLKSAISECFHDRVSDKEFYNQIIEVVIGQCIQLYKHSQLLTCKNHEINEIRLISDHDNSCPICQTMSKFAHNIDNLLADINKFHPFCKLAIELPIRKEITANTIIPTTDIELINLPTELKVKVNNFVSLLKRNVPDLVTTRKIKFVNNITEEVEFNEFLLDKFGEERMQEIKPTVDNQVMYFKTEDVLLINNKALNRLEYIMTLTLIEDKLKDMDIYWWTNAYNNKQKSKYVGDKVALYSEPFVSYIAEQNAQSYFIESAIYYVINPKFLKTIDADNYDRLKEFVFNNIEFVRG
jgi:hypothetical protein